MKILLPPLGYMFNEIIDSEDEKAVLGVIRGLSDELYEAALKHTHKERLKMLKENGFEIIKE